MTEGLALGVEVWLDDVYDEAPFAVGLVLNNLSSPLKLGGRAGGGVTSPVRGSGASAGVRTADGGRGDGRTGGELPMGASIHVGCHAVCGWLRP